MLTLRQIQDEWNRLAGEARPRGIVADHWVRLPPTRDRGMLRLNWLRRQLGLEPHADDNGSAMVIEAAPGATLPLRAIQAEWNSLVPAARAQGLRVETWAGLPPTARRGMQRLAWLRQALGATTVQVEVISRPQAIIEGIEAFAGMTFGVELECIMPYGLSQQDLARALTEAGISMRPEVYNHSPRPHWKIVTDGSLGDYSHGIEVVSPVLSGQDGFDQLNRVCQVLVAKRIKISKKCGFHVHLGIANESLSTVRNTLKLYAKYAGTINTFLAPSRRDNSYCRDTTSTQLAAIDGPYANAMTSLLTAYGQDWQPQLARSMRRYRKVNLQAYNQHRTIEFRQHQGTVEPEKATSWVKFCLRMMLAARTTGETSGFTIDSLVTDIGLSSTEASYFRNRAAYFARLERNAIQRRAA